MRPVARGLLRRGYPCLLSVAACLLPVWLQAQSDPFVGRFSGRIDGITHELILHSDRAGYYDGELRAEGLRLPVIGRRFGDRLTGRYGFPDDATAFRARALGAVLLIERQAGIRLRFYRQPD